MKITNIKFLVNSVLLASLTAGLITLFIDIPSELPRYYRTHGSPIIFGDLAMLFGLLSFSFSFLYYKKENFQFGLLILGGCLGIVASLYSGSRGGWLALITVPFLFIVSAPREQRLRLFVLSFALLGAVAVLLLITDNPVRQRVNITYLEILKLIEKPDWLGGSISSRLALFKISMLAFMSNPLFGIGIGEFYAFKMNVINANPEQYAKFLLRLKHSHSEYLGILSGMGLVGVLFYVTFLFWLTRLFKKALKSTTLEIKVLGLSGLTLLFCYLDFSLTESVLSSKLGSFAFYFILTLLIYFMTRLQPIGKSNALEKGKKIGADEL